jgi:hypothetical protein
VNIDRFSKVRRLGVGLWLALAGLAVARPAAAENAAQAEALFERGLSEMQAGNYDAGCPKLAESYRLDPLPGALFTLAECEAAWSKVATAIEHYQSFVDGLTLLPPGRRGRFDERRRLALEKIAALSATAPELTLDVAPGAASSLVVRRNGEPVDPSSYGVARKVDPGAYVFSAELDGQPQWERSVRLALSDRVVVQVPWPLVEPSAETAPPRAERGGPSQRAPLRPWLYASGAVGAAGLVAGAVAGGLALGKEKVIAEHCQGRECDAQGYDAAVAGQRAALISSVGFALGLAGAAAATTLFLLERRRGDARPSGQARRALRPSLLQLRGGVGLSLEGSL